MTTSRRRGQSVRIRRNPAIATLHDLSGHYMRDTSIPRSAVSLNGTKTTSLVAGIDSTAIASNTLTMSSVACSRFAIAKAAPRSTHNERGDILFETRSGPYADVLHNGTTLTETIAGPLRPGSTTAWASHKDTMPRRNRQPGRRSINCCARAIRRTVRDQSSATPRWRVPVFPGRWSAHHAAALHRLLYDP